MEHGCCYVRTQDHPILQTITEALGPATHGQAHLDFQSPGLTLSQTFSKSKYISSFSSFLFQFNRLLKSCLKNKLNTQRRSQLDGYFSNTQLGISGAAPTGVECLPTWCEDRSDLPYHQGRAHTQAMNRSSVHGGAAWVFRERKPPLSEVRLLQHSWGSHLRVSESKPVWNLPGHSYLLGPSSNSPAAHPTSRGQGARAAF